MSSGFRSTAVPPAGPGWLGRALVTVLGLNVALAWMAIQASLVFAHAVWLLASGHVLSEAEPGRIASQIASLRLVQAVLWLSAAGLFLGWIHRARRTLETLDAPGVRSAPGGVGDLLVPGPNLVRIPCAVTVLWRGSAGDKTPPTLTSWVAWWWTLCLATVVLDLAAIPPGRWLLSRVGFGGGLPLRVLGECVRIAAAVLTIVVVTRIDACQRRLFGRPGAAS
jgi:hypothetical protein